MYYLREKRKLSLTENFSNVSFMNTDITGVRFSDKARWGGEEKKAKEDRFKIVDERLLEERIKKKMIIEQKT
jgi:hypothetical protein